MGKKYGRKQLSFFNIAYFIGFVTVLLQSAILNRAFEKYICTWGTIPLYTVEIMQALYMMFHMNVESLRLVKRY